MKPLKWEIIEGDCRDVLATLPVTSAQTCITSPPYWGLRDYGAAPSVWGGDPECEHEWREERYYVEGGGGAGSSAEAFSEPGEGNAERIKRARWREDATCERCDAWRGVLGLEPTPERFTANLVEVFRAVRRVLRDDGTLWLNLGDTYNSCNGNRGPSESLSARADVARNEADRGLMAPGLKTKDLVGVPWRVAFALQADGWYLRSDIIWHKPNPMPEAVTDRPTKAHEYIFLLTKRPRYYYDADAVREASDPAQEAHNRRYAREFDAHTENVRNGGGQPGNVGSVGIHARPGPGGRNRRSIWTVTTQPFAEAHFATFPPKLIEPCILAGAPKDATVLDPFSGAATTGLVAQHHGRDYIGIELNPEYAEMSRRRLGDPDALDRLTREEHAAAAASDEAVQLGLLG